MEANLYTFTPSQTIYNRYPVIGHDVISRHVQRQSQRDITSKKRIDHQLRPPSLREMTASEWSVGSSNGATLEWERGGFPMLIWPGEWVNLFCAIFFELWVHKIKKSETVDGLNLWSECRKQI